MESINLLRNLTLIDSSTVEDANEAIEFCATYLKQHGIHGQIMECNGVKSFVATVGKGDKTLIFNGHLDVVSGKKEQFIPRIEGDRFYARGAADMKGGVVANIEAFKRLRNEDLGCVVMLQLVADEEVGGLNGTKYLVDQGYIGDFVICTEPTNMTISIQAKGIMRLDILTKGFAAHGSRPWEGENAILKAIRDFEKIQELPIMSIGSEFYEKTSINLAFIEGGDIYNRVPDNSKMGLDIRYVPQVDPQEILKAIEDVVEGEVIVKALEPSINVPSESSRMQLLKEKVKEATGTKQVQMTGQHGSSDNRFFSGRGIPAVELGPIGSGWHGDDEYVSLESIKQLEEVLFRFALSFH